MLVGEQPGDAEDERGRPFVGPAGQLFRDVLAEVGPHHSRPTHGDYPSPLAGRTCAPPELL